MKPGLVQCWKMVQFYVLSQRLVRLDAFPITDSRPICKFSYPHKHALQILPSEMVSNVI